MNFIFTIFSSPLYKGLCAKKYTKELFELAAEGAEKLYLDQLLPPISIEKYIKYIPFDTKVFVVDKDPRDLYLVENLYNGSRFVPFENIDTFIAWYKATREKSLKSNDSKSVYHCYLDDLVYDYENQLNRIEKFLGWNSEDHKEKLKKFDPSKSCVNTRLYEKYTNYESEIKKIENTIPELCKKNNGVIVEQQNNSNINFRLPVAEVLKKCDSIQDGEKNNTQKFRIAIVSTILIKNIRLFSTRKGLMKKIKGLIKIIIGLFVFIPDLIINLCIIK